MTRLCHATSERQRGSDSPAPRGETRGEKKTGASNAGAAQPAVARSSAHSARRRLPASALPKPVLRGWQHAIIAPLALANMIVQIVFAPTAALTIGVIVFGLSAVVLFGHSAVYHLGSWGPKVHAILRRLDHSNIFLLIAGTYTPLSLALLPGSTAALVLAIVWGGALGGIALSNFWPAAPRWLYVPLYIALGWVAIWFLPDMWEAGGPGIVWLIIAGGICYTVGALAYAFRWPNPWPRTWGFHEFFHSGTVAGYACHAVAVWLTLFAVA
ncbi:MULTISPECIES: PAQR family membrane homeostasis protein TrhA [Actinotignum]|uniref:PAQR family membrane homeostasis protein TrhA n=1 Tax=Actinotignum TaxID=1653174 RepID=UPI00254FE484|nr:MULTISPECIES: hemolysin III family protein [Actinotignum]MDK7271159.1 hemolysin III family protein [Actinotignum schaalii]MDY5144013.1 hemolysin III family protein [Actinotignum timonense]